MNFTYVDDRFGSKPFYNLKEVAQILNLPKMGKNNILKFLRYKGVLNQYNDPTKNYKNQNYFKARNHGYEPVLVTSKGAEFIAKLLE